MGSSGPTLQSARHFWFSNCAIHSHHFGTTWPYLFVSRPCGRAHAIANPPRLYPKCFSTVIKMRCWLFGEKSCVGKCPHMTKKQLRALPKCQMKSAEHFYCQQESSGGPRGASDHENPDF